MLRHIEPAILGEAGEQHVLERMGGRGCRRRIAGAEIAHGFVGKRHYPNLSPRPRHCNRMRSLAQRQGT